MTGSYLLSRWVSRTSTIGLHGLDFRVRNGNGYFPMGIATSQKQINQFLFLTERGIKNKRFLNINNIIIKYKQKKPRSISTGHLKASQLFQLQPIKLVVYQWSYLLKGVGYIILRGTSHLDAFSAYSFRHSYPARITGVITGTLEVSALWSSRTKSEPSQISCACGG